MSRDKNPLSAYVVGSHIAFVVAAPLIFFIGGGTWLTAYMEWDSWVNIVFILLGIIFMVSGLVTYLVKLVLMYGDHEKEEPAFKPEKKDFDFYYENDKN